MKSLAEILSQIKNKELLKNNAHEFQVYGIYLAECLEDTKHYSLYIKLAKTLPRGILEEALNFCKDYKSARNKGKVFMWKLKQLRTQKKLES